MLRLRRGQVLGEQLSLIQKLSSGKAVEVSTFHEEVDNIVTGRFDLDFVQFMAFWFFIYFSFGHFISRECCFSFHILTRKAENPLNRKLENYWAFLKSNAIFLINLYNYCAVFSLIYYTPSFHMQFLSRFLIFNMNTKIYFRTRTILSI